MANNQLACTYAALLLADSGKTDAASILAVTKAAGLEVSSGFANVYASILKDVNLNDILSNLSFGGAAAGGASAAAGSAGGAAAGGAAPAAAAAAEPEEEEDDDMGFGLFD